MSVSFQVGQEVSKAFASLYGEKLNAEFFQIESTKLTFEGDQTLVVFPLLKITKKSPEESANLIGNWLISNSELFSDFNVVKGFLNLSLKSSFWISTFNKSLTLKKYGFNLNKSGKTYMVEYSSPNTNKPLHLGHLRNNFLGYAVSEILKANGHNVVKTQIINDRGIHICKSMLAWQKFGNGETPESANLKGDHLIGKYYVAFDKAYKQEVSELIESGVSKDDAEKQTKILKEAQNILLKWENKDPEIYNLWKRMNNWVYEGFNQTYQLMGVDFDKLYYESDTFILGKDVVSSGLELGIFYKKEDGSVWCDLSEDKLDDKLLLRADGTSVYMTQDLGTAIERYKDYNNLSGLIYTVGNEQNHHFKVLFTILKKLGYSWAEECFHLSYGMVELPEGRMKSREGTVVDADDLILSVIDDAKQMTKQRGQLEGMSEDDKNLLYQTIGKGGLKYYLLKVDPKKKMMFNPAESIDLNGNTAPFIQYCYARIQSILRKGKVSIESIDTNIVLSSSELHLIKLLADYPNVVSEAGKNLSPALIANYSYDLVKAYNSFYQSIPILGENDEQLKAFRIVLSEKISLVIESAMKLLGIEVPQKM
ncbi:arginine--tRNA ligase [Flavobacteriales bacterium]|nr:arginine--tRNA ligase [Flavobacteriales bacterium]